MRTFYGFLLRNGMTRIDERESELEEIVNHERRCVGLARED